MKKQSTVIKNLIICETYKHIDTGNKKYNLNMVYPEVSFDLKGQAAGKTFVSRWLIKYNYPMLEENFEQFINNTTIHEVSHLIEYKLFGKVGHKSNWKKIMRDFGIDNPQRCHNYKLIK